MPPRAWDAVLARSPGLQQTMTPRHSSASCDAKPSKKATFALCAPTPWLTRNRALAAAPQGKWGRPTPHAPRPAARAFTPVTVVDGTVGDGDGGSRGDETADGWQTAGYGRGNGSRRGRRSAPAAGAVESAGSVRSPLRAKRGADNAAGGTNVSQLTKLGGKPGARGASGSSPSR